MVELWLGWGFDNKILHYQIFEILSRREGNLGNIVNMLRTYFLLCRKFDIVHGINLIKTPQFLGLLIIMSIFTSSFYKYISLGSLFLSFSLIVYIIISEFLWLKSLHEDLKLACSLNTEGS